MKRRAGECRRLGAMVVVAALVGAVGTAWTAGPRLPWQKRVGRHVEVHHRWRHETVGPQSWPEEPTAPPSVDVPRFASALRALCGPVNLPPRRAERYAEYLVAAARRFEEDPFLMGALMFDGSRCLPRQPEGEPLLGLTRIDLDMHAPHIRRGVYRYFVWQEGTWRPAELSVPDFPFNRWKLVRAESGLYWTAAILAVWRAQHASLDAALPQVPHRHYVSHWFFGDVVRSTEPEDRVLSARRRLLAYYAGTVPAPAGRFGELDLVAPVDGVPRLLLDRFGSRRRMHVHQGIDIKAETGEPVRAVADGMVVFSGIDLPGPGSRQGAVEITNAAPRGDMGPGGRYVVVRHANGLRSYYMHLDTVAVQRGDAVAAGDVLGTVGCSGAQQSGPHLHLEFRVGTERVDPTPSLASILVFPSDGPIPQDAANPTARRAHGEEGKAGDAESGGE